MKHPVVLCAWTLCYLLSACAPDVSIELEARTSSLQVSATITSVKFDFEESTATYFADVSISNTTENIQLYSNKWLWLESGGSLKARAYLDSIASHQVDVDPIELDPNETQDLNVYWVFPSSDLEETSDEPFVVEIQTRSRGRCRVLRSYTLTAHSG